MMQKPIEGDFQFHTETTQDESQLVVPLHNLSQLSTRMDSLHTFITQSINANTLLPKHHMDTLSTEILSSIRHVIINANALLSSVTVPHNIPPPNNNLNNPPEVVELDAVELLLANNNRFHSCEVCGKGFTRDANLRMHMRAHGDRFKSPEALRGETRFSATRFSCPYEGCRRNRHHDRFRPLNSLSCLRSHFKRSHCPKTHTCERCRKKSFAVLSDLKSHMRQCRGESTWKCSCGTTFSGKGKLFGHVALFEGHVPALEAAGGEEKVGNEAVAAVEGVGGLLMKMESGCLDDGLPEGFFDDLENYGFDSF